MTSAVVIGCPVNAFRNVSMSMVADRRASDSVPGTPNLGDEGNPAATAQANRHATESIGRGAGPNHSQQVTPRRLGRVYGDPMTESASPQASASASVPTPAPAQVGEASVEKVSFAVPGWVRRHRLEAHGIKRGLGAGLMLFGLVVVIGGAGLITAQALGSQSDVLKDNLNSAAGFFTGLILGVMVLYCLLKDCRILRGQAGGRAGWSAAIPSYEGEMKRPRGERCGR